MKCKNCSRELYRGSYRDGGFWEPDYNPYDDPITLRHKHSGYAACLAGGFATVEE